MSDSEGDSLTSNNREIDEWVVVSTPHASDSEQNDEETFLKEYEKNQQQPISILASATKVNIAIDEQCDAISAECAARSGSDQPALSDVECSPLINQDGDICVAGSSVHSSVSDFSVVHDVTDDEVVSTPVGIENTSCRTTGQNECRVEEDGVGHTSLVHPNSRDSRRKYVIFASSAGIVAILLICSSCSLVQFKDSKMESQKQLETCKSDLHNKRRQLASCKMSKDFCDSEDKPVCHSEERKQVGLLEDALNYQEERDSLLKEIRSLRQNLSASLLARLDARTSRLLELHWLKQINEILALKLRRVTNQIKKSTDKEKLMSIRLTDSKYQIYQLSQNLSEKDAQMNQLKDDKVRLMMKCKEKALRSGTVELAAEKSEAADEKQFHRTILDWSRRSFSPSYSKLSQLNNAGIGLAKDRDGHVEKKPRMRETCSSDKQSWHHIASDWTKIFLRRINEPAERIIDFSTHLSSSVLNESNWEGLVFAYNKMKDKASESATSVLHNLEKSSKLAETVVNESLSSLSKLRNAISNATESADDLGRRILHHLEATKRLYEWTEFSRNLFVGSVSNLQRFYELISNRTEQFVNYYPDGSSGNDKSDNMFDSANDNDKSPALTRPSANGKIVEMSEIDLQDDFRPCADHSLSDDFSHDAKLLRTALKSSQFYRTFDPKFGSDYKYYLAKLKQLSKRVGKFESDPQDALWWICQINWWAGNLPDPLSCPLSQRNVAGDRITVVDCDVFLAPWQKSTEYDKAKWQRLMVKCPDVHNAINKACISTCNENDRLRKTARKSYKHNKVFDKSPNDWLFDRWRWRQMMRQAAKMDDDDVDWIRQRAAVREALRR